VSWPARTLLLIPAAALLAGCGQPPIAQPKQVPTTPVSGKVTYKGKAMANCSVVFHAADGLSTARGQTDAAGLYRLTTFAEGDGAAPGNHKVTVVHNPNAPPPGTKGDEFIPPIPPEGESFKGQPAPKKSEVPAKYASPATTDVAVEVKAGEPNTINIDLK
jgi:hypothetical protein